MTRPFKAGEQLGRAVIETAHLMYQNDTALHFLEGLVAVCEAEIERRTLPPDKKEGQG